jgi:hypothetical protein
MKADTFVQFLQKFWFLHTASEHRKAVELLNANPLWVGWVRWYSHNYILDLKERSEAPFEGSYDIKTIKEAWNLIRLMLGSQQVGYETGYRDGVDSCFEVTT